MAKEVNFTPRERMLKGLYTNCDAVIGTLGPRGGNVWIDDAMQPKFTNDGATISRSIVLKDPIEESGNKIAKNTTNQTLDDAGDGTTTTACLLKAIVKEGVSRPENGRMVRESLLEAVPKIVKEIQKKAKKIDKKDIKKVALVSANDDVLATKISEIINKLGDDAVISIEDSYDGAKIDYELSNGYEAGVGFMSEAFATDRGRCVMEDVPIVVSEKKIAAVQDIGPLFEYFKSKGITSAVIVCEDIENAVLGLLVTNKRIGNFNCVVIRATGDLLKDIEAVVGATRISDETGVTFQMMNKTTTHPMTGQVMSDSKFVNPHLGIVSKLIVDANKSIFIPKDNRNAKSRADFLKKFAENEQNIYIKERLEKRISQLNGKIAILKIGGQDFEREYLKDKADDAIKATKVALQEGVVEGGGMCLWRIAQSIKPKTVGEEILKKALIAPLKKNIENAGQDYAEIVRGFSDSIGYDTRKNEYSNLLESGIIDPAKVERCALENATANAATFLTGYASITELPESK